MLSQVLLKEHQYGGRIFNFSPMQLVKNIFSGIAISEGKNSFLYFITSIVNALLGIITLPIYTRYLTPAEFGIWGIVIAINNFLLPIFQLGLNSFFLKENYNSNNNGKSLFSTLLLFTFIWSGILIFFGALLGPLLFNLSGLKVEFYPYMWIILVSNLSVACFTYLPLKYRIEGNALMYSLVLTIKAILVTAISLILVATFNWGIMGRVYGFTTANFLFIVFCIPFFRKYLTLKIDPKLIITGVKKYLPLVPAVIATLLFDTLDRLFIEHYLPLEKVGFYNVAAQFAAMFTMGYLSLFKAVEPKVFELSNTNKFKEIEKLMISVFLILGVAGLLSIVLAKPILELLISKTFEESIPIAKWLILVVFMQGVYLTFSTYNVTLSRNKSVMYISTFGLLLYVVSLKFLTIDYGVIGAAISKSLVFAIMAVVMWFSMTNAMKFSKAFAIAIIEFLVLGAVIFLI